MRPRVRLAVALALGLALPADAGARELHWRSLEVDARLDADGELHVIERQLVVFTGAWNGGERRFRVETGQRLELRAVRRTDPVSGATVDLRRGDLGTVDRFDWHDGHTLRWRSRAPSDPPFDRTAILYELDYVLTGVVNERDGVYWLSHDFAFADRAGVIERFELRFDVDRAWQPLPAAGAERVETEDATRLTLVREALPPGRSVVLDVGLKRRDATLPAAVRSQLGGRTRLWIAVGLLAAVTLLVGRLIAHERRQGRYRSAAVPESPDRAWLEEHLLSLPPEVVGAIWDHRIGPAEVAAVLARLIAEGRLASSVRVEGRWFKRQILELELLCDRQLLEGYDRRLVDRLFYSGRDRTDTRVIRERYRSVGFSPASTIRSGVERQMRKLPGFGRKLPKASPAVSMLIVLAALVCLVVEGVAHGLAGVGPVAALSALVALPTLLLGHGFATWYRRRADRLWVPATALAATLAAQIAALGAAILYRDAPGFAHVGAAGLLALALLGVAVVNSVSNAARTRDRREAVDLRRRLVGIRRRLAAELRRPDPALDDAWLPYLLALGLDRRVERWLRAFGGTADGIGSSSRTSPIGSTGSSGSSWTGGGGAFGGAGATSAWTAAAGAMAAGVSRPSSGGSGGGSSGGGGGGSSGGGGGGGW